MKIEKKKWRPSPPLLVVLTVVIVIAGMLFAGWLNARRYRVKARVEIGEPAIEMQPVRSTIAGSSISLPDGEVAKTAVRVREVTGLLMGLATLAVTEQMSNRSPANANALVGLMVKRHLLPPGIRQTPGEGVLISDSSTIYARYRSAPLGIEIVSIGSERTDGPAIIVRLAAGSDDDSGAVLLIARKAETPIPAPFATVAQILAMGWNVEPLRERSFAPEEIEQLNSWTRQYAATGK
ncbi:MAG TPA: hypothetical protein VGB07_16030 [Blastocatellia bacterium]|jgi:hypothetical protein|nr:hypothetical protein [Nitrosomonas nitrosa]